MEDAGTRNGTFVAGARISAPIPVGEGLSLKLGGEVPCSLRPSADGSTQIEVGGRAYFAPLGPLRVGDAEIDLDGPGGDDGSFIVLRTTHAKPAFLGEYQLAPVVELAIEDAPSASRSGAPLVVVLPGEAAT